MPNAFITGASRGLGYALAAALARQGWNLVVDARTGTDLSRAVTELSRHTHVTGVTGDVTDPAHRRRIAGAVAELGQLDLLVNNASTLGSSPLPKLADARLGDMEQVLRTNVVAPLAIFQSVLPYLAEEATILNITSDASIEAYQGWGMYGSSKAALDHLSAILAVEHPRLRVYALDPGDMRTQMHQDAFPGEDISDRPDPEDVVPRILALLEQRPPSGRYRASEMVLAR